MIYIYDIYIYIYMIYIYDIYIYIYDIYIYHIYIYIYIYASDIGVMVRVLLQWPGRPGFNPRSSHTKDFKNGT